MSVVGMIAEPLDRVRAESNDIARGHIEDLTLDFDLSGGHRDVDFLLMLVGVRSEYLARIEFDRADPYLARPERIGQLPEVDVGLGERLGFNIYVVHDGEIVTHEGTGRSEQPGGRAVGVDVQLSGELDLEFSTVVTPKSSEKSEKKFIERVKPAIWAWWRSATSSPNRSAYC